MREVNFGTGAAPQINWIWEVPGGTVTLKFDTSNGTLAGWSTDTPQFEAAESGKAATDLFTTGATHMALLHNSIIRGFNSIYLQAPHVPDADKAAFVGYAQTWFRFVKSHHDDEEANLFTKVEEILGDDTIWAETHEEHGEATLMDEWR
jgi:hypothetical protein